jgi:hypothetical protein
LLNLTAPTGANLRKLKMNNIKYQYKKFIYNHVSGYLVMRWIDGVYAGQQFGKTKKEAVNQFFKD